ncbi:MAG: serine hydrolase domain-containing protein [Gemmatimonadales bacterium]
MTRLTQPLLLALLGAPLLAPRAPGQGLPLVPPESVNLTAGGLARIDSAMNAYVESGKLPGIVVAVARNGRLAHWKAFGLRSIEHTDPMETDDLFRIYSMTKPVTSVAMMLLVEEGRVGLEDPVAKYLPAFAGVKVWSRDGPRAPRRPMTIRDLLQHTSGLTYGLFGETPVDSAYRKAGLMEPRWSLTELMDQLARLPLVGDPGEIWNYGFSTDVAGRIIEVVSGMPLDRFMAQRIFGPLKMTDTFFEVPPEKRSRLTGYYAITGGPPALIDSPDTGSYTRRPPLFSGGGGLASTVPDYLRFAQMILNGGELDGVRLLRRETVAEMLENQLPPERIPIRIGEFTLPGTGFGLGFSVVVDPAEKGINDQGRAGWAGYANTFFWIDPNRRLIAMVFAQSFPFSAHPLELDFRRLVYQALR